jgi:hypothetical protein
MEWTLTHWSAGWGASDGIGRTDPNKKTPSFSVSYKSLCTTFPQLWINEIKDKEGKILED